MPPRLPGPRIAALAPALALLLPPAGLAQPGPVWEEVPAGEVISAPGPEAVAARPGPHWELVPEGEAIEAEAAIAEAREGADPGALPEPNLPRWPRVRGLARGITVAGEPYPDVALLVPNGFAMDPEFTVSTILDGVNRTRRCSVPDGGSWVDCADAVAYLEVTPFKGENASLGFQWAVQSLTSRNGGTAQFAAQSLGFRTAVNLSPSTGLAFGGEHIVQFDSSTDLGRNFYLVLSQALPLSRGPEPMLAVATFGIGSDFYGYRNTAGNGTLGSTDCLSGNNVSSRTFPSGRDCWWGPIGSLSLQLNSRLALGAEWFGYGFGAGLSLRPIPELPFTVSLYATDFLGNNPGYISSGCTSNPCEARYYGKVSLSF